MLRKNEEREGVVASVGAEGEGILKDEGIIVFVPFALPGEKIRYKVLKVKDKFAFGKVCWKFLRPRKSASVPNARLSGSAADADCSTSNIPISLKSKKKI